MAANLNLSESRAYLSETVLSDNSKVYDIDIMDDDNHITLNCFTQDHAEALAEAIKKNTGLVVIDKRGE